MKRGLRSLHLREDAIGAGGPDDRFGVGVVSIDVLDDRAAQIVHVLESATFHCVLAQVSEEAFDHAQP